MKQNMFILRLQEPAYKCLNRMNLINLQIDILAAFLKEKIRTSYPRQKGVELNDASHHCSVKKDSI